MKGIEWGAPSVLYSSVYPKRIKFASDFNGTIFGVWEETNSTTFLSQIATAISFNDGNTWTFLLPPDCPLCRGTANFLY